MTDWRYGRARSCLATGAEYNKPSLPGLEQFAGKGIYYNATFLEAQLCSGEEVIVIGGGNSAGQAAVFLSQNTRGVHMLVRSKTLIDTMSRYLIQRIEENHRSNCTTRMSSLASKEMAISRRSRGLTKIPARPRHVRSGTSSS